MYYSKHEGSSETTHPGVLVLRVAADGDLAERRRVAAALARARVWVRRRGRDRARSGAASGHAGARRQLLARRVVQLVATARAPRSPRRPSTSTARDGGGGVVDVGLGSARCGSGGGGARRERGQPGAEQRALALLEVVYLLHGGEDGRERGALGALGGGRVVRVGQRLDGGHEALVERAELAERAVDALEVRRHLVDRAVHLHHVRRDRLQAPALLQRLCANMARLRGE